MRGGLLSGSLQLLLTAFGLGSSLAALGLGLAREPLLENLLNRQEINLLRCYKRIDLTARAHLQHLAQIGHSLVDGDRNLPILQLTLELLAARAGILVLLGTEVGFDAGASLRRNTEREPIGLRSLVLLRHNLHDIAIMQHLTDRHGTTIHPRARTGCAEVGVDIERKVQHGSTLGEFADVAIGRKDKDLAGRGGGIETLRERLSGLLQHLP